MSRMRTPPVRIRRKGWPHLLPWNEAVELGAYGTHRSVLECIALHDISLQQ